MSSCIRIVRTLPTAADMFRGAADEFVRLGRELIARHGRFVVALSGGSTPRGMYALLAGDYADFPWGRTFLFWGDERHVAPDHSDSNYRMVSETLLRKAPIPSENVFRVKAERPDAAAAAADYEATLRSFFKSGHGEFPKFDMILLGLGPDGHTASLFPDSEGLKEQSRLVIANWVDKFKTHRISFTFPLLNHASDVMFLVSGGDKAEVVSQILEGQHEPPYPAQLVQPQGRLLWLLDSAAAGKLSS